MFSIGVCFPHAFGRGRLWCEMRTSWVRVHGTTTCVGARTLAWPSYSPTPPASISLASDLPTPQIRNDPRERACWALHLR